MKLPLSIAALALAAASCAPNNPYDTGAAPASPTAAAPRPAAPSYGDAIYGSQPEYGDNSVNPPAPAYQPPAYTPSAPVNPPAPAYQTTPAAPAPQTTPAPQAATTHEVVRGDTLSGIAAKYKVPMASIKAANNMTSDTVVLGKKLVIPAP